MKKISTTQLQKEEPGLLDKQHETNFASQRTIYMPPSFTNS